MRVGQVPITDVKSLREALKACPDGKPVTLFLRKGKDTRFVEVTPEKE